MSGQMPLRRYFTLCPGVKYCLCCTSECFRALIGLDVFAELCKVAEPLVISAGRVACNILYVCPFPFHVCIIWLRLCLFVVRFSLRWRGIDCESGLFTLWKYQICYSCVPAIVHVRFQRVNMQFFGNILGVVKVALVLQICTRTLIEETRSQSPVSLRMSGVEKLISSGRPGAFIVLTRSTPTLLIYTWVRRLKSLSRLKSVCRPAVQVLPLRLLS